jgi:transposase
MMGQQTRTESLFYYFRLEDQIPKDHLLRVIDERIDLSFVRERVKTLYSTTGRPSIDPEMLLRLLLVGYGITSERRLLEEVRMNLAYRWFTGLNFEQEVPDLPRSPRIAMVGFVSRACFARYLKKSCVAVCRQDWRRGKIWQSTAR